MARAIATFSPRTCRVRVHLEGRFTCIINVRVTRGVATKKTPVLTTNSISVASIKKFGSVRVGRTRHVERQEGRKPHTHARTLPTRDFWSIITLGKSMYLVLFCPRHLARKHLLNGLIRARWGRSQSFYPVSPFRIYVGILRTPAHLVGVSFHRQQTSDTGSQGPRLLQNRA